MDSARNDGEVADAPPDVPFDYEELLGRCVGRPDLVERVLKNFAELLPGQFDQITQASAQQDLAKVRTLAHRLKGGALTVSAHRLGKYAERLEEAAGDEAARPLDDCLADLGRECTRLTTNVRARLKKE